MTEILIVDIERPKQLMTSMEQLPNTVTYCDFNNALSCYEEFVPDIVLINFSYDPQAAFDLSEKLLEFDHTCCIFGLTNNQTTQHANQMYQTGIRVIIHLSSPVLDENPRDRLIEDLYRSCNDLEHEKCIGCWKTGRFEDLPNLI